jgi:A/G-specific adenine glycosylase
MADIVPERAFMIDSALLLRWYEHAQRDLPWRRADVTPWQILVSEFMLQQTPVARVEPIWLDWVARWPTPSATAAANAADVLRAWGKLGSRGGPSGCTSAQR